MPFFITCPCGYREQHDSYSRYVDYRFKRHKCPACGAYRKMGSVRVKGKKTNSKCDDSCKYAVTLICHCECEGKNHGINWKK